MLSMGAKRSAPSVYPLRRVESFDVHNFAAAGAWIERLECGHEWHGSIATGSRFVAKRRRCRACFERPLPEGVPESWRPSYEAAHRALGAAKAIRDDAGTDGGTP